MSSVRGNACRLLFVALLLAFGVLPGVISAQSTAPWEYSPYEVRIILAVQPSPQLSTAASTIAVEAAADRLAAAMGAAWHCTGSLADGPFSQISPTEIEFLTAEQALTAPAAADAATDKVYFAAASWSDSQLTVALREFDCRARQLGPVAKRTMPERNMLSAAIEDLVRECFTPLARIETVGEQQATARLRAAALATDAKSPVLVPKGAVFRPIIRRTERKGQTEVQEIPWTLLEVNERRESLLECTLYSGYRAAIPSRASARVERLALLVRPHWPETKLSLRARDNPAKPLANYEIHTRLGNTEKTDLLGLTNLDGEIEIPREDGALLLLFVRHGKQLLARLPLVPGHQPSLTAEVADDDLRLEAEGYTEAIAARIVDLVARREILAARFRAKLKEGQAGEAQKLLDEFRKLETRTDLSRELEQTRQRLATKDRLSQSRIDKLFDEARKLLQIRALGDELLGQLTRELAALAPAANP